MNTKSITGFGFLERWENWERRRTGCLMWHFDTVDVDLLWTDSWEFETTKKNLCVVNLVQVQKFDLGFIRKSRLEKNHAKVRLASFAFGPPWTRQLKNNAGAGAKSLLRGSCRQTRRYLRTARPPRLFLQTPQRFVFETREKVRQLLLIINPPVSTP